MKTKVRYSMETGALAAYVSQQVNSMFPDDQLLSAQDLMPMMDGVFQRVEHCFCHVNNAYYFDGESVLFNHLHADQYAMFLYILSREAFLSGAEMHVPTKIFLLNKALHAVDAYFEIALPSVFLFVHPMGTVLGRAEYGEYLTVYQRCGVGSNHEVYPSLGRMVTMHPGSSVLGKCLVGDNVSLASDSLLLDGSVESNSVYIGNPRDCMVRPKTGFPEIWRDITTKVDNVG